MNHFCTNCGSEIPKESNYCEKCGHKLSNSFNNNNNVNDAQKFPIKVVTLDMSIGSMILGLVGFVGVFLIEFFVVASLFAVISGHLSRTKIHASKGNLVGDKYALIGLFMGYLGIFLVVMSIYFQIRDANSTCNIEDPINRKNNPCFQMRESFGTCNLILDSSPFSINYKGEVAYTYNGKKIQTKIKTTDHFYINSIVDVQVQNDILFMYLEHSNGLEGDVSLLALDLNSGHILWKNDFAGLNASRFLVANNNIFITAGGFVSKINMQTGEINWSHYDLHMGERHNSFLTPCIEKNYFTNDYVVFRDSDTNKRLLIDLVSGDIN